MNSYRVVGGTVRFGPGQLLGVNAAQLAARLRRLDIVERTPDGGALVRARETIEFKVGERIALDDVPKPFGVERKEQPHLVPLDANAPPAQTSAPAAAPRKGRA